MILINMLIFNFFLNIIWSNISLAENSHQNLSCYQFSSAPAPLPPVIEISPGGHDTKKPCEMRDPDLLTQKKPEPLPAAPPPAAVTPKAVPKLALRSPVKFKPFRVSTPYVMPEVRMPAPQYEVLDVNPPINTDFYGKIFDDSAKSTLMSP